MIQSPKPPSAAKKSISTTSTPSAVISPRAIQLSNGSSQSPTPQQLCKKQYHLNGTTAASFNQTPVTTAAAGPHSARSPPSQQQPRPHTSQQHYTPYASASANVTPAGSPRPSVITISPRHHRRISVSQGSTRSTAILSPASTMMQTTPIAQQQQQTSQPLSNFMNNVAHSPLNMRTPFRSERTRLPGKPTPIARPKPTIQNSRRALDEYAHTRFSANTFRQMFPVLTYDDIQCEMARAMEECGHVPSSQNLGRQHDLVVYAIELMQKAAHYKRKFEREDQGGPPIGPMAKFEQFRLSSALSSPDVTRPPTQQGMHGTPGSRLNTSQGARMPPGYGGHDFVPRASAILAHSLGLVDGPPKTAARTLPPYTPFQHDSRLGSPSNGERHRHHHQQQQQHEQHHQQSPNIWQRDIEEKDDGQFVKPFQSPITVAHYLNGSPISPSSPTAGSPTTAGGGSHAKSPIQPPADDEKTTDEKTSDAPTVPTTPTAAGGLSVIQPYGSSYHAELQQQLSTIAANVPTDVQAVIEKARTKLLNFVHDQRESLVQAIKTGPPLAESPDEIEQMLTECTTRPMDNFNNAIEPLTLPFTELTHTSLTEFNRQQVDHEAAGQCFITHDGAIESCPLTFLPRNFAAKVEELLAALAKALDKIEGDCHRIFRVQLNRSFPSLRATIAAMRIQSQFRGHLTRKSLTLTAKLNASPHRGGSAHRHQLKTKLSARPDHVPAHVHHAARRIQSRYRGYAVRVSIKKCHHAAKRIQAHVRGHLTRKKLKPKTTEEIEAEKLAAWDEHYKQEAIAAEAKVDPHALPPEPNPVLVEFLSTQVPELLTLKAVEDSKETATVTVAAGGTAKTKSGLVKLTKEDTNALLAACVSEGHDAADPATLDLCVQYQAQLDIQGQTFSSIPALVTALQNLRNTDAYHESLLQQYIVQSKLLPGHVKLSHAGMSQIRTLIPNISVAFRIIKVAELHQRTRLRKLKANTLATKTPSLFSISAAATLAKEGSEDESASLFISEDVLLKAVQKLRQTGLISLQSLLTKHIKTVLTDLNSPFGAFYAQHHQPDKRRSVEECTNLNWDDVEAMFLVGYGCTHCIHQFFLPSVLSRLLPSPSGSSATASTSPVGSPVKPSAFPAVVMPPAEALINVRELTRQMYRYLLHQTARVEYVTRMLEVMEILPEVTPLTHTLAYVLPSPHVIHQHLVVNDEPWMYADGPHAPHHGHAPLLDQSQEAPRASAHLLHSLARLDARIRAESLRKGGGGANSGLASVSAAHNRRTSFTASMIASTNMSALLSPTNGGQDAHAHTGSLMAHPSSTQRASVSIAAAPGVNVAGPVGYPPFQTLADLFQQLLKQTPERPAFSTEPQLLQAIRLIYEPTHFRSPPQKGKGIVARSRKASTSVNTTGAPSRTTSMSVKYVTPNKPPPATTGTTTTTLQRRLTEEPEEPLSPAGTLPPPALTTPPPVIRPEPRSTAPRPSSRARNHPPETMPSAESFQPHEVESITRIQSLHRGRTARKASQELRQEAKQLEQERQNQTGGAKSNHAPGGSQPSTTNGVTPAPAPSTPRPPPKFTPHHRVLFSFNATEPGQLSIKKGELVEVQDEEGRFHGWWTVRNQEGRIGHAPCNYISQTPQPPPTHT